MFRFLAIAMLLAVSSAFQAPIVSKASMSISMNGGKGFGGGEVRAAHPQSRPNARARTIQTDISHPVHLLLPSQATRDPEPTVIDPNDPKGKQQAIHKAETFAEYLAKRKAE